MSGCSTNSPDAGAAGGVAAPAAGNGTGAAGNTAGAAGAAGSNTGSMAPPLVEGECQIDPNAVPSFVQRLDCSADFEALASEPLDDSIPGARSGKAFS